MANDCIPFEEPGARITGHASAAVTGKRFLKVSGNRETTDNNVRVAHADAAGRIIGVAGFDAAINKKVTVIRGAGMIVPVTADGAIAAFAEVEVGANGKAKTIGGGIPVGVCMTAVIDGADAQISLYDGSSGINGGDAAAAIAAHEAAANPHPVYLTQAEADVLYAPHP